MNWHIQEAEIWMIIGFLFIFIELIKLPDIGFLFLGLGCLSVAITVASEKFTLNYDQQIIAFIIYSSLWFILLWRYLRGLNSNSIYSDIIGNEVIVITAISPNIQGQVRWSGTVMNAILIDDESRTALINQILIIDRVIGNVLVCKFKSF